MGEAFPSWEEEPEKMEIQMLFILNRVQTSAYRILFGFVGLKDILATGILSNSF